MPSISVIITSYNQAPYLTEAIESVLNQTVMPTEIIIADDYSTLDDSVEVIGNYERRFPQLIKAIYQLQNTGIPRNRNAALRAATGEYVTIVDGDDRLHPDFVATHLEAIGRTLGAQCSYSNFNKWVPGKTLRAVRTETEPTGNILAHVANGRMGMLRSMVARTHLVRKAGGMDERFPLHDGFILSLRLARHTPFVYIPSPLMDKREHKAGVSKAISPEKLVGYFEGILAEVIKATTRLTPAQRRKIQRTWERRLIEARVAESLSNRDTGAAFRIVFPQLWREPARIGPWFRLLRKVMSNSGKTFGEEPLEA